MYNNLESYLYADYRHSWTQTIPDRLETLFLITPGDFVELVYSSVTLYIPSGFLLQVPMGKSDASTNYCDYTGLLVTPDIL